ncbi:MAG: methyltransferase, partial [Janthinobacterium lividum]
IRELSSNHYAATQLSNSFTEPRYRDGLIYTYDVAGPSFCSLPKYFKSIAYAHPTDIANGPFQYAHNIKAPFFAFLAQNAEYGAVFNNYMSGYRAGKPSWVDAGFYPFTERVLSRHEPEKVLLVDVGGGMGHDLAHLRSVLHTANGNGKERLVLQDQADVIAQVPAKQSFEATVHDFFTEQPVKGATAYYLHSVLHDWSDEDCGRILRQIAGAMERGYSRVLVNELVIPSTEAAWSATSMDWLMMALGAVKERTETEWRALIEGAGLKVTGIWTVEQGTESLIEAELA